MEKLLESILKSDAQAKAKIAEAEAYRAAQMASLQSRKEEIEKEEIKKAVDEAVRISESRRSRGSKQIDALKRTQEAAEEKMEALFKKNEKKWISNIVKNVIEE